MERAYETRTLEHKGQTFTVQHFYDQSAEAPWDNGDDGRGVVHAYRDIDQDADDFDSADYSAMGRSADWYFDWKATRAKAVDEGWGTAGPTPGMTPEQITEAAVQAEYKYLSGYANDDWHYCGVVVSHALPSASQSLWGVESNAGAYLEEVARELADQQLERLPALLDAQIAHLQAVRGTFPPA